MVYSVAADADTHGADRKDCAAAILYAAENATQCALDAIQVGKGQVRCSHDESIIQSCSVWGAQHTVVCNATQRATSSGCDPSG